MTQITQDQQQHLQATAVQVAAKLQTFHADLTAAEQALLDLSLRQAVAEEQDLDVSGHAPNPVVVWVAAKAVVKLIDWVADRDWSWDVPPPTGGGSSGHGKVQ